MTGEYILANLVGQFLRLFVLMSYIILRMITGTLVGMIGRIMYKMVAGMIGGLRRYDWRTEEI